MSRSVRSSNEFVIVPPEGWSNGVLEHAELVSQFMNFYHGKSTPRTWEQLKYVVHCCIALDTDMQMYVLKKQCGWIDGLASRRVVEQLQEQLDAIRFMECVTPKELTTLTAYFRAQVKRMEVPLTDPDMMRRARSVLRNQEVKGDTHIVTTLDLGDEEDLSNLDEKNLAKYLELKQNGYIGIQDEEETRRKTLLARRACAFCLKPELQGENSVKHKRCSKCKQAYYDTVHCQQQHWKQHLVDCRGAITLQQIVERGDDEELFAEAQIEALVDQEQKQKRKSSS